jgi:hypothetical protein
MEAPWRIELLGGLRARHGERVVARFRTQKAAELLASSSYALTLNELR